MAAIQRERREAVERVRELLARGVAATEPRYTSIEVAWQVLEAARDEEPLLALRLIDLAWDIAGMLAAREPKALLHRQLLVEVRALTASSTRRIAPPRRRSCAGPICTQRSRRCLTFAELTFQNARVITKRYGSGIRKLAIADSFKKAISLAPARACRSIGEIVRLRQGHDGPWETTA